MSRCAAKRYTVAPFVDIAPRVFYAAILASVLAVGIRYRRACRRCDRVRCARVNFESVAVRITLHFRLTIRRCHFDEPQFFYDKVNQEIVLLISCAVRLASVTEFIHCN